MNNRGWPRAYWFVLAALIGLAVPRFSAWSYPEAQQAAPAQPTLTEEEMKTFLLTAKVIKSRSVSKGITGIQRLTLSDGSMTQDAAFQAINETKTRMEFGTGRTELNFRDSYHYNIAGYELSKLLGLDHMMPVTVERSWNGRTGSLSWWLKAQMDEGERMRRKVKPPNVEEWNKQMHCMRLFSQLVYDTDRNLGNCLISPEWKLYMIDFTRAFRLYYELEDPRNLVRCDRQLLERLRKLDSAEIEARTKGHLNKMEIKGLMMRRDKIVVHFEKLVAKLGETEVLF